MRVARNCSMPSIGPAGDSHGTVENIQRMNSNYLMIGAEWLRPWGTLKRLWRWTIVHTCQCSGDAFECAAGVKKIDFDWVLQWV